MIYDLGDDIRYGAYFDVIDVITGVLDDGFGHL